MKFFSLFLSLMATSLLAKDGEPLNQRLSIPHEKYVLDNGLNVILAQDKSTPFVAVSTWYRVGAIDEHKDKTGLAHLFEHLMFEGSRHVKDSAHFNLLERAGAFDVNATTSFDRTNYYQTLPKSELELALSLESSRMTFLDITKAKLDEQRAVVRREREQRFETSPYGLAALRLWQSIFPKDHPLHGRVIGSHQHLESASLNDVKEFYDRNYGPSNASLALVGDFDKEVAKKLVAKYFSTLPKSKTLVEKKIKPVVIDEQEVIEVEEKLGKLALVRLQYITPKLFAQGDAELDVIAHILTGSENGRLTKAITRDQQLAASVSAYQQSLSQISIFTIDALINPGVDENQVIAQIDKVLRGLSLSPSTAAEIERARNTIITGQFLGLQSLGGSSGRAELLQSYNRFANTPDYIQQDIRRYSELKRSSLILAAKKYLPVGRARKILFAKPTPTLAHKGDNQ